MVVRAIALSLALLVGYRNNHSVGDGSAESGSEETRKYKKGQKKYKKYSKRWWRQHRANLKRKRALQARRRAMRLRQLRLAEARGSQTQSRKRLLVKTKPVDEKSTCFTSVRPGCS